MDSGAERQKEYRNRMRARGYVKREVWVPAALAASVKEIEVALRAGIVPVLPAGSGREGDMGDDTVWTTRTLHDALRRTPHVEDGTIELDLVEGAEPAIAVRLPARLDDLPILVTVSGGHILVEAALWPVASVPEGRRAALNETLLSVQRLFPLSRFAIDGAGKARTYVLHGALSSASSFDTVLLEIETLADNVVGALDLYDRFAPAAA